MRSPSTAHLPPWACSPQGRGNSPWMRGTSLPIDGYLPGLFCSGSGSPSPPPLGHESSPEQELVQGCSQLSRWGPSGGVERTRSPCVNSSKPSSLSGPQCPIFRMDLGMLGKAFWQRVRWPHGGGSHQLGFIQAMMRGGREWRGPGCTPLPSPHHATQETRSSRWSRKQVYF